MKSTNPTNNRHSDQPVKPPCTKTQPVASSSGSSMPNGGGKCNSSCVRLIREILQNPNSRPRQVLHALIGGGQLEHQQSTSAHQDQPSFTLKPLADGVEVEMRVPDTPFQLARRWTSIAPPALRQNTGSAFPRPTLPVLATSSRVGAVPSAIPSAVDQPSPSTPYTTETIKIECRACGTVGPEQGARALIMGPNPLSIVACTNRLTPGDREEMSQVLVHELLHAYDVKRLNLDFTDCESMAYSEVRAAREAECHGSSTSVPFLKEYCVKQKAIAATHNLFPLQGRKCVSAVFSTAYQDARPFLESDLRKYVQRHNSYTAAATQPHSHQHRNSYTATLSDDHHSSR